MDNIMLTATPLLTMTLTPTMPNSAIVIAQADDNGTHPHNVQCQLSSITATFIVQAQMLHTINMLLVELDELADKPVDDPTGCDTRPLPSSL